jgi:F0F1-type ATP synthase epsilon subunit
MSSKTLLEVKVRDTENIIFEGQVERISSFNEVGPFDVYPTHANFISILRRELVLYRDKKKIKEMKLEQAVLKVKKDAVHIFLGIEAFQLDEENEKAPEAPAKK